MAVSTLEFNMKMRVGAGACLPSVRCYIKDIIIGLTHSRGKVICEAAV